MSRLTSCVLQAISCASTSHPVPVPELGGVPHVRFCLCAPVPQVFVQIPSFSHEVQLQFSSHYGYNKNIAVMVFMCRL